MAAVVDVFTNRTVADLDLESNKLDSILIRLACGHIFTVKTLDSICELREFYSSTPDGRWTGLSAPPTESAAIPPTCLTCRGSITAQRYGRVYKRANLDILERTVATKMRRQLNELNRRAAELLDGTLRYEYSKTELPDKGEPWPIEKRQILEDIRQNDFKNELPLHHDCLWSLELHGITEKENQCWNRVLKPLLQLYKAVTEFAATRSAHVAAYEAALSWIYNQEITVALHARRRPPSSPSPEAKRLVGTSPPLADKRFRVEAIWLSVELRYILGRIALSRLDRIRTVVTSEDESEEEEEKEKEDENENENVDEDMDVDEDERVVGWATFIDFIFKSCVHDTYLARKITADCGTTVQSLGAVAKYCRAILQHTKAKCVIDQSLIGSITEEKNHWKIETEWLRAQAELFASDEQWAFFFARCQYQTPELVLVLVVEDKLMEPINLVLGQWNELITRLSSNAKFLGPPALKVALPKRFPDSACSVFIAPSLPARRVMAVVADNPYPLLSPSRSLVYLP